MYYIVTLLANPMCLLYISKRLLPHFIFLPVNVFPGIPGFPVIEVNITYNIIKILLKDIAGFVISDEYLF